MSHDPKDCGMSSGDFKTYFTSMRKIIHATIENHPQTL